jgi:hypothetical protein
LIGKFCFNKTLTFHSIICIQNIHIFVLSKQLSGELKIKKMNTQILKTVSYNTCTGHNVEIFEVLFVDHSKRQAKNMILTVAKDGNYFVNPNAKFEFERNVTIMDGTKKDRLNVPMGATIIVNTPIGVIELNNQKATLL